MKPTNGNLLHNGIIVMYDKPFALLQSKKQEMIRSGIKKEELQIKYLFHERV